MRVRPTLSLAPLLVLIGASIPVDFVSAQDVPEGSVEAVAEFSEGMKFYVAQQYTEALPHFYKARELDPTFVVSLFFAALCEGNLGSDVPGDSLYEIVLEYRDRISPYYVQRAESQLAKRNGDRAGALEHSRNAAHLAPGSKAWYNLGYDLLYMNRPMEARDALLQLDPDKPPMKGWYGYFGVLASSHHLLGDFEEELAVTREARKRFPERRAALVIQARALAALGLTEELETVLADGVAMPGAVVGNSVGAIMTTAAAELKAHGFGPAGDAMFARAVAWYEAAGEAVATPAHLVWSVTALIGAERWQDAADACEKQLALEPNDFWCHSSRATMALKLGDRARFEAEKAYFEGEAPNQVPTFLPSYMAFLEVADGNVEKGVALLEEAMSLGTGFNLWWHTYPGMNDVLAHPAYQEFLRPKG